MKNDSKLKLSVILIAKNEELKIKACLDALYFADEIILVDSGSTDRTLEIASDYGCRVFQRPFDDYSAQKNYALGLAKHEWVFSVDADEIITKELVRSIQGVLEGTGSPYNGYYVFRDNHIFGKAMNFAGQKGEKILRFFKKSKGYFVQPIHEFVQVQSPVGVLNGRLIHNTSYCMTEYLNKLNRYTDAEAQLMNKRGVRKGTLIAFAGAIFRFFYYYIFLLGFLDGRAGLIYHTMSSFYYFTKIVKLQELVNQQDNGKKDEE